MLGLDNPIHILFVLVIVLLVFGAKRLPEMGKSLGEGLRGFKDSVSGDHSPSHVLGHVHETIQDTIHDTVAAHDTVPAHDTAPTHDVATPEPAAERVPVTPGA
jgi:TatA/E family protein of Tat protein translocase